MKRAAITAAVLALLACPVLAAEPRVGTVFPYAEIPLLTQAGGRVARVSVQEGARVRRGEHLLGLDRSRIQGEIRLLETQIAHRAALRLEELDLINAKDDLARETALANDSAVPKLNAIQAATRVRTAIERVAIERGKLEEQKIALALKRRDLADYDVVAPADGIVSALALHENQVVGSGARVGDLLRIDQVLVETFVPLADARRLGVGSRATIHGDGLPAMAGRVKVIAPKVDPVSSSVRVKVLVPNAGLRLKPGMLVRVAL